MFVLGEGVLEPEKQFLAASPFSSVSLGGRGWYRWVGLAPCSARQARLLGAPQGWVVPSGASQVDPPSSGTVAGRLPSGAQLTPCGRARRKCPSGSESPASRLPDSDREVIKSFHVSYQVSGGPAVFLVVRQSADARGSRGPDLPASSALTPACPRWQKPRPALSTGSSSPGRDVVGPVGDGVGRRPSSLSLGAGGRLFTGPCGPLGWRRRSPWPLGRPRAAPAGRVAVGRLCHSPLPQAFRWRCVEAVQLLRS